MARRDNLDDHLTLLGARATGLEMRISDVERRLAVIEERVDHIDRGLGDMIEEIRRNHVEIKNMIGAIARLLGDHERRLKVLEGRKR